MYLVILLVSVGIPSYNEGVGILRIMEALRNQKKDENFAILEVIVLDDSSDNTPFHVNKFIANQHGYPQLRMIHHDERRGQPAAWNELMREAKGDILVLLDGDVVIHSDLLSSLVRCFKSDRQIGLVAGNAQPFNPRSFAGFGSYLAGLLLCRLQERASNSKFTVIGRCVALKREVIDKVVILSRAISSDLYLTCRSLELGYKVVRDENSMVYFHPSESFRDFASQTIRAIIGHRQLKKYSKKLIHGSIRLADQLIETLIILRENKNQAPALIAACGLLPIYAPSVLKGSSSHIWEIASSSKMPMKSV